MQNNTLINKRAVVFCNDIEYAVGLVRCLGEAGYYVECFYYTNSFESKYILASRYVKNGRMFSSKEECLKYLLEDYPVYNPKPVLFTMPDPPAFLVDTHKADFEKKFILMSAGKDGDIAKWMDKGRQSALAEKVGLIAPWMIKLHKTEEIPHDLKYPVFTKSTASMNGGKCDEGICHNREELVVKQKEMKSEYFLVMKYIQKKAEVNYFGLSIGDHVYVDYKDNVTSFTPKAYGNYINFFPCSYDTIHNSIVEFIKATKYQGLFDVEFLLGEDNVLYFVEVNFRCDGELYLLTPALNLPAEWCRLVSLPAEQLPLKLNPKQMNFWGMAETFDFRDRVRTGQVNFFKWFWQFVTADSRMLFNAKDPIPFFYYIAYLMKQARNKIKRKFHK